MNKFRKNFELPEGLSAMGETNNKDSLTIQGDTVPLREMLRRYQLGQPLTGRRAEYWNEETFDEGSLIDAPGADLVDVHAEVHDINERFSKTKKAWEEEKKKKAEREEAMKLKEQKKQKEEHSDDASDKKSS